MLFHDLGEIHIGCCCIVVCIQDGFLICGLLLFLKIFLIPLEARLVCS